MNRYKYLAFITSVIFIVLVLSSCFLLPKPTLIKPQLISPSNGATNVTITATLVWNSSNVSQTIYKVFFSRNASCTTLATTTQLTSFVEANLSYLTTYYWKVVATVNGQSATSTTWSFTTMKVPAPSAPVLKITGVSTNSIALGWTQSKLASMITVYGATSTVFSQYAILSGSSTSYTVSGLIPLTAYKFFLVATNSSGRATSNTVSATTQSYTPPVIPVLPVINTFGVTSVSTNTITLGFTTSHASIIYMYNPPSTKVLATALGTSTAYTVQGLTPSTAYKYFIVAINPFGRATSTTITATTAAYISPTTEFSVYITDKPVSPSQIQHLYVKISGISVHITNSSTGMWYTSSASGTYDLTTLVGTSIKLATFSLPSTWTITQIRFNISSATIVINGTSYPLNIPSSTLYINTQAISAFESNSTYLDFDLANSVEQTGQGYIFKPVIHPVNENVRASVKGVVLSNSQPVPMAAVSLTNSSTTVAQTYTKPNGSFMIVAVQSGSYTLTVSASGLSAYSTSVTLVKGMNNIGTINLSQMIPSTPTLSLATPSPYLAVLTWTQSISNANGFHVWESNSPMQAMTEIQTLPGTVTNYDVAIKPYTSYYFTVSAYNSVGQTWSNTVSTKTTVTINVTGVPSRLVMATSTLASFTFTTTPGVTAYLSINNGAAATYTSQSPIANSKLNPNVWNTLTLTFKDPWQNTIKTAVATVLGVQASNPANTPYVFLIDKTGHIVSNTNDWIQVPAGQFLDLYGYIQAPAGQTISNYNITEQYFSNKETTANLTSETSVESQSALTSQIVPLRLLAYLFNTSTTSPEFVQFTGYINNQQVKAFLRYQVQPETTGPSVSLFVAPTYEGVPAAITVTASSNNLQPLTGLVFSVPVNVTPGSGWYGYTKPAVTAYGLTPTTPMSSRVTYSATLIAQSNAVQTQGANAYGFVTGSKTYYVALYGPSGTYNLSATVTSIANATATPSVTYLIQADTSAPTVKVTYSGSSVSISTIPMPVYYGPMTVKVTVTDDHAIYWAMMPGVMSFPPSSTLVMYPNNTNITNYGQTLVSRSGIISFPEPGAYNAYIVASDKHFDPTTFTLNQTVFGTGNTVRTPNYPILYSNVAPQATIVGGQYQQTVNTESFAIAVSAQDNVGGYSLLSPTAFVKFIPINSSATKTVIATATLETASTPTFSTPNQYSLTVNTYKLQNQTQYQVMIGVKDLIYDALVAEGNLNPLVLSQHITWVNWGVIYAPPVISGITLNGNPVSNVTSGVVPTIANGNTISAVATDYAGIKSVGITITDLIDNVATSYNITNGQALTNFSTTTTFSVKLPTYFAPQYKNLPYQVTFYATNVAGLGATPVSRLFVTNTTGATILNIKAVAANQAVVTLSEPMWVSEFKAFVATSATYDGTITSTNIAPTTVLANYEGYGIAAQFTVTFGYNVWGPSQIGNSVFSDLSNVELSSSVSSYVPIVDLAGNQFTMQ